MRLCQLEQSSPTFVASGIGLMEDHFSMDPGGGGFQEDSGTLLLLRTLFLLHQLHIRSSGIRYQRLRGSWLQDGALGPFATQQPWDSFANGILSAQSQLQFLFLVNEDAKNISSISFDCCRDQRP